MTNRKFFDIILVYNEYHLVEERIKLFENKISKFVVYDFGDGHKNYSSENVYHIKAPQFFLEKDFDLYYETLKILDHKKLYMEDVFLFSKANEILDIDNLISHTEIFDIKPVIFKQKKVFWFRNRVSPKHHFSPHGFTYSQYFTNKNLQDYFSSLINPIPVNKYTVDCGWQINGFQDEQSLIESLEFWNNKNVTQQIINQSKRNLTDFDGNLLFEQQSDLPENFCKFESQNAIRETKNIFVTLDLNNYNSREGIRLLVSNGKITASDGQTHIFDIPKLPYYSIENFELSYSKNELLKVCKTLKLLPHDFIVLQKEETLEEVSMSYQEFRNCVPSELF